MIQENTALHYIIARIKTESDTFMQLCIFVNQAGNWNILTISLAPPYAAPPLIPLQPSI